ncbi:hypothetical protein PCANC_10059 [Puccinia coronata f. sp. avenae]|uniref:Uncharacterized protein n=1 Tax=Puccinia coronata f. sp. avenae TaxID=200324 RepID=A0A2N5V0P4_9BASI|nr:hypothetical protein PCANC_10059 [Puccinia coronata f. sp. avenae]
MRLRSCVHSQSPAREDLLTCKIGGQCSAAADSRRQSGADYQIASRSRVWVSSSSRFRVYSDCTNDGNVAYKCDLDSCHGGEGAGNPRTHPMSNFAFVKCSDADLNGNPISNPDKRVYVYNFEFNRATNRLDVLGYTKPTKSNVTPAHFNCDRNTVRPWCDRCYRA